MRNDFGADLRGLFPRCVRFTPTSHPASSNTRYWPVCSTLARREFHPLDYIKKFHRLIFGSSSSKFYLARCPPFPASVAVGMPIARHPPHRPVLARLTHTVLTSDTWRQSVPWDTGVGCRLPVAGLRAAPGSVPRSSSFVDYVDGSDAATNEVCGSGIVPGSSRCQEQHDIGNIPSPLTVAILPSPQVDHATAVSARH